MNVVAEMYLFVLCAIFFYINFNHVNKFYYPNAIDFNPFRLFYDYTNKIPGKEITYIDKSSINTSQKTYNILTVDKKATVIKKKSVSYMSEFFSFLDQSVIECYLFPVFAIRDNTISITFVKYQDPLEIELFAPILVLNEKDVIKRTPCQGILNGSLISLNSSQLQYEILNRSHAIELIEKKGNLVAKCQDENVKTIYF